MKKKLKRIFGIFLSLLLIAANSGVAYAAGSDEDNEVSIYGAAAEMAEVFEKIGIDNATLIDFMNLTPKDPSFYTRQIPNQQSFQFENDEEFWGESSAKFIPLHINTEDTQTLSNGEFNGSPPASKKEQKERMEYITKVFENEYGVSYPEGEYLAYLYTSHYTENAQYDHNNPQVSFRSLLPYIICSEDIVAYNQFFARANNIKVMNDFKAIGGALSTITADGVKKAAFIEGCGDIRKAVLHFTPQLKEKLEELYITDEETVVTSLAQIAGLYNKNYEQAQTDNELIQLIVDQTDIGGICKWAC